MRFRFLAGLALLSLASCNVAPPISAGGAAVVADATLPPPAVIADQTIADETGAIGFEVAVATAADLATLAVQTGVVPAAQLPRLRLLTAQARASVAAVRAAYRTGNATSYWAAVGEARSAIQAVRTLATGAAK